MISSEIIITPLYSAITCCSGNLSCVYSNYTIWLITAIMPLSGWILKLWIPSTGWTFSTLLWDIALKFGECRLSLRGGVRFLSISGDDREVWGWIQCDLFFLFSYQNVQRRTDCSLPAPGTEAVLGCWIKSLSSKQGAPSVRQSLGPNGLVGLIGCLTRRRGQFGNLIKIVN